MAAPDPVVSRRRCLSSLTREHMEKGLVVAQVFTPRYYYGVFRGGTAETAY